MLSIKLFFLLLLSSCLYVSIETACKKKTPPCKGFVCSTQYTYPDDEVSNCTCICAKGINATTTQICSHVREAYTRLANFSVRNIGNDSLVMLIWNQINDLDLRITINETSYYSRIDANIGRQVTNPIEYRYLDKNITSSGRLANVRVRHFSNAGVNTTLTYYVIIETNNKRQINSGQFTSSSEGQSHYINTTFN